MGKRTPVLARSGLANDTHRCMSRFMVKRPERLARTRKRRRRENKRDRKNLSLRRK